uniref:LAGLIDADG endonuclease n=1 Tax=Morchella brunnea TaxID=1174671 RepID=A0A8K1I7W7_9PEZI|nr:LAGLIDADG endonuclease [Morchella brunnea]UBU98501.1 LAGLIDADG endonuclease [Morchella brunnea]
MYIFMFSCLMGGWKSSHGLSKLSQVSTEFLQCPYFITGLSDGESSFCVSISKYKKLKTGWLVRAVFRIELHSREISLLYGIQSFFGVGNISIGKTRDTVAYSVGSTQDLTNVIIPHFLKYP